MTRAQQAAAGLLKSLRGVRGGESKEAFATGYLSGFEHSTAILIARWLRKEADVVQATRAEDPATRLRELAAAIERGNWRTIIDLRDPPVWPQACKSSEGK